ncbi:SapC family protein [Halorhodospira halochloris]|uniref:SapC family protein n=1 Tax=Halorhodospira halochloris TaxID=1052 RepID=UPI001EE79710|nr:SapC family protein [Halorhodospira halochloris]MCG5548682.1 SapC family protein [Halorhodospira halochloris]
MTQKSSLKPLSSNRHRDTYWQRARGYFHAAENHLVPVTSRELPRAVGAFPLVITYQKSGPILQALLGVESGRSAFVDSRGRWRGGYVPAYLGAYPFYLVETAQDKHVVAVDEASAALQADAYIGQPLFTADDKPTPQLQKVIDFLGQVARNRALTDRACRSLDEAGILEPWPLELDIGNQPRRFSGLYRVSEKQLHGLEGAALQVLRDTGALASSKGIYYVRHPHRSRLYYKYRANPFWLNIESKPCHYA